MTYAQLIEGVDEQIAKLAKVKSILEGQAKAPAKKKRYLSPQALKKISDAQHRRWAKAKRAKKAA